MTSLKIIEKINISGFFHSSVRQGTEAKVLQSYVETVSSPELDIFDEPFNEFDTANLETLAFPTLFPDRLGDPNDNVTTCDNSQ